MKDPGFFFCFFNFFKHLIEVWFIVVFQPLEFCIVPTPNVAVCRVLRYINYSSVRCLLFTDHMLQHEYEFLILIQLVGEVDINPLLKILDSE